jgi:hypothetical protein
MPLLGPDTHCLPPHGMAVNSSNYGLTGTGPCTRDYPDWLWDLLKPEKTLLVLEKEARPSTIARFIFPARLEPVCPCSRSKYPPTMCFRLFPVFLPT